MILVCDSYSISFGCNLVLEAVSFYLTVLEFATSCWNLYGVSTGREVMRRLDLFKADKDACEVAAVQVLTS